MAVPKKKMSRSRTRQRKATWRVSAPTVSTCPQCRGPVRPHTACPTCGAYKGRQVLEVE
jgi:large subunit ribosomal protein L32